MTSRSLPYLDPEARSTTTAKQHADGSGAEPGDGKGVIYPEYCHDASPTILKWCPMRAADVCDLRDVGMYIDGTSHCQLFASIRCTIERYTRCSLP